MKHPFSEGSDIVLAQGSSVGFDEDGKKGLFFATLHSQIDEFAPLPPNVIFFGVARDDGRPVLLNVLEPSFGSILIRGNVSSGKTALMQAIASGTAHMYTPRELQFVIVTPKYLEWANWVDGPGCGGVYSSEKRPFEKLVNALDLWLKRSDCSQTLLFFIDGLRAAQSLDPETEVKLQRLLAIGPYRNIWPIVTATEDEFYSMVEWSRYFKKQVLSMSKKGVSVFEREFAVKEDGSWCKFSMIR